jgi:AraC-like DNA-binding protein
MPILLSHLSSPAARSRLAATLQMERAARVPYEWLQAAGWSECRRLAAERGPHLLVFDPYGGTGLELGEARAFRDDFPAVVLVPYGDFQRRPARDVLVLAAELGVQGIVTLNADDQAASLRLILTEAQSATVVGRVLAGLEQVTPPELVPLLRIILQRAHAPVCPDDVANAFHRHCKTIRDHLRAAGFPPLNKLIVWARLFHAAMLLQDRSRSLESVALVLHFPSPSALHNQFTRYAGERVRRAVHQRGVDALLEAFIARNASCDWEMRTSGQVLEKAGA